MIKEDFRNTKRKQLIQELLEVYDLNEKLRNQENVSRSLVNGLQEILTQFGLSSEFLFRWDDVGSTLVGLCSALLNARSERDALIRNAPKKKITKIYIRELDEKAGN